VVLDPFLGSGTTAAVAKHLGRHFIGFERDSGYADIARRRIDKVQAARDLEVVDTPAKRRQQRIPFGWLVERGLLEPGTLLYSPDKRWRAKVRADGTLITKDFKGSIHQAGAHVQGAAACNGWQFWCLDVEGRLLPIDILREKLRANLN
jgi:modification methylase